MSEDYKEEKKSVVRLEVVRGNGYHCGCCRNTELETEDFDSVEEASERVTKIKFLATEKDEDIYVRGMYLTKEEEIEIPIDQDLYDSMLKELSGCKEKEAKEKEARKLAAEKAEFERLKKLFEE